MSDAAPNISPKQYLSQRFAKLPLGQLTVIGYSVAGEETVVQVPELNVCFDIGRAPQFALTSDYLCISHGHMDHIAGIAYYLSQRYFQGMRPGTVLLPAELLRPVDELLKCWQRIERQDTPYTLVPMLPGEMHQVRKDFGIRALRTHHGGPSLGFSCISIREKLKPEFHDRSGEELVKLKREGTQIQYTLEVPLVTYLGDTGIGPVFETREVVEAQILITECTFFEAEHQPRSRDGRHLHASHLCEILPRLKNEHVVLLHVSRRTGLGRAKKCLRKLLGGEIPANVQFLMDLRDARHAGDAAAAAGEPPVD
jgi:ribonuclease Z